MDPILYWNDVANEANRTTHTTGDSAEARSQGPCGSSRTYAIVHLAMHDAYFGINKNVFPTYLSGLPVPGAGANSDAAIAAAAHATLDTLYPSQRPFFNARHAAAGLSGAGIGAGHAYGIAVAAAMLGSRSTDPGLGDAGYVTSLAPGHHRPDPDNSPQGFHAPYYGAGARCFGSQTRHQLLPPPSLTDAEYLTALRQVRGKGIAPALAGTLPASIPGRTPDETLIGVFWAYDGVKGLGTPPRLYNQIVRRVAEAKGNTVEQNARLFALFNAAMGDAGVLAWQVKYRDDLWRPVVGVREHGSSQGPLGTGGNPIDTDTDPFWLPLGAPATNEVPADGKPAKKNFTPPFPAYPSGHATFGAAAFQSVRRYYDPTCNFKPDKLTKKLVFVSDELDGINRDNAGAVRPRSPRTYPGGLWQMIEENGRSRVFLGVHWVFDAFAVDTNGDMDLSRNIGGVPLGLAIADEIAAKGLDESQRA
jgi:hypothetical protein